MARWYSFVSASAKAPKSKSTKWQRLQYSKEKFLNTYVGLSEKLLETDFEVLSPWEYKRVEAEVAERDNFFAESGGLPCSQTYPPDVGEERRACLPPLKPVRGPAEGSVLGPLEIHIWSCLRKAESRGFSGKRLSQGRSQLHFHRPQAEVSSCNLRSVFKGSYPRGLSARTGQP